LILRANGAQSSPCMTNKYEMVAELPATLNFHGVKLPHCRPHGNNFQ
jgi:hypothetical protein